MFIWHLNFSKMEKHGHLMFHTPHKTNLQCRQGQHLYQSINLIMPFNKEHLV